MKIKSPAHLMFSEGTYFQVQKCQSYPDNPHMSGRKKEKENSHTSHKGTNSINEGYILVT